MPRFGRSLAFAVLFSLLSGISEGQLSDMDREQIAGQISSAARSLDPALFPDLAASQAVVLDRVTRARQFFDLKTSPENRDAWLLFLDLDPLVEKIESGEPAPVVGREAIALRHRLIGTAPGLELTVLRSLRDAVEQLIEAVRFRDREKSAQSLAKQLESLAERIRTLDANPSAEDFAVVSTMLGVLESSGQAKTTVQSLRSLFGRPNLVFLVSESMVQSAVNRDVNQSRPVRDCILGTRIVGDATLTGTITAHLLPAIGAARVNVTLAGQVYSKNVGYNGPVRLRTIGHGEVEFWRSLTVNESGITLDPAQSRASLRTRITSIEHKLGLVRKIARKRAAQQKPQVDRIAAERMRMQVGNQFASQMNEASSIKPPDPLEKVRPLLKRLSLVEPTRIWSSNEQAICIDTTFRRGDQMSSVVSRPAIMDAYDVAIQIHESAVDNGFTPVLAGRTLKESQIQNLLGKAGRPIESQLDADGDEKPEPPFEIDFARLRPIVFEARQNLLRVGVRGTRFAQGSRELKQSMEISAAYEPASTEQGTAILLRKGDVDVSFPGRKRLSVSQAGLKRTIQKKFSKVFPSVLLDRPIEIAADAKIKAVRGRVFRPRLVDARDGWLTIAIR